jgi:hypothetical protein
MKCIHCNKEIPDDSDFCCYCGKTLKQSDLITTAPASTKGVNGRINIDEPIWGMHLNMDTYPKSKASPSWLKPVQRENWVARGVIVWDKQALQVTKLWASQALNVFKELNDSESWKENGVVVGEPAMQFTIPMGKGKNKDKNLEKKEEGKWVLANQIHLTNIQTQEFKQFLERNEPALREMAAQDEKDTKWRFSQVYRMIFGEELWNALGRLYKTDPEESMKLAKEILEKRLGHTNETE